MQSMIRIAVPALALALLSACASRPQANEPVYSPSRSAAPVAVSHGVVRSIEAVGTASDQPQGAGAVMGGVLGAVIGRQFADSSSGKNVGTVAGAVGGALIGNEVEKNVRRDPQGVRVNVQLDQGGARSFEFKSVGELRVGDRVRIEGNQLYRL
jgi:outer membrane lipoprotein SlyB